MEKFKPLNVSLPTEIVKWLHCTLQCIREYKCEIQDFPLHCISRVVGRAVGWLVGDLEISLERHLIANKLMQIIFMMRKVRKLLEFFHSR